MRGPKKSPLLFYRMSEVSHIQSLVEKKLRGTDQFKLAVYIDKPAGITLDECTALTRHLLEELEPSGFLEKHDVEVGSPGMYSPLRVPQQYQRRIGQQMKIRTTDGREMTGVLQAASDESAEFKEIQSRRENKKKITSEVIHTLPYEAIREAKLVIKSN
jgi:ribosome maturation factor RimP